MSKALWLLLSAQLSAPAAVFTSSFVTNLPLAPGPPASSIPYPPVPGVQMGSYFYFAASDGPNGSTGLELWRTDGTPGGTTLVKDIYPGAAGSSPNNLVAAGTNLYFIANDGVHGRELWKSDGTAAGTMMVIDLNPGPADSSIQQITAIENNAVFALNIPAGFLLLSDLFWTDGTAGGTFRLSGPGGAVTTNYVTQFTVSGTNIALISNDSSDPFYYPTNTLWRFWGTGPWAAFPLIRLNNYLYEPNIIGSSCYFVVPSNFVTTTSFSTNYYTMELLLRASLTLAAPVQQVDATKPDTYSSAFGGFQVANGRLFYSSSGEALTFGSTFWFGAFESIGESDSPVNVEPPGSGGRTIIGSIGGQVYYLSGSSAISRTDGVSPGAQVLDLGPLGLFPSAFTQAGSLFFFMDQNSLHLAVTDLTPGGTYSITNAPMSYPGSFSSGSILGALGNLAIYSGDDGQTDLEPYRSDGTTNGTYLLKDIATGIAASPPIEAVASGGLFFFTLDTPGFGIELWKSDGTAAGTAMVKDIRAGTNSSLPSHLTTWSNLVFFSADNGTNGPELWRSDGSDAGTYMVKDVRVGPAGSNPSQLTATPSQLFFVADDGSHGAELWRSDGTSAGTSLVQDVVPGVAPGNIRALGAAGGQAYFFAGPTNTSAQLWISDGTPGGTQFLYDFGIQASSSLPTNYIAFGGKVYFRFIISSFFGSSPYLWVTDDTPAGTAPVSSMTGNQVAAANGTLFASAVTNLWTSDGTLGGTVVLTNLSGNGSVGQLTVVNSNLYFTFGQQLWSSDGTINGTLQAATFSGTNQYGPDAANLTPFQGALVFTASTPLLGRELWATAPGQGASMIEDLSPLSGDANVVFIAPATNQVFYVAKPSGQPFWQVRTLQLESLAPLPGPYGGTPWPVPGLIEAENFDLGGEGVAYHDTTADNEGVQYRPLEGVDIEACNDTNGGFCVFNTMPTEWLSYTIDVAATGLYELDVRVTSAAVGGGYHFEVDGQLAASSIAFNNGTPGGWYTDSIYGVGLTAGRHILRQVFDTPTTKGDVGVYNSFVFTLEASNEPPVVTVSAPPAGAIYSAGETVPLTATVVDFTTVSAPQAEFFVDGQSVGVSPGSPYEIGWTVTPGPHTVHATATDSFGASATSPDVLFFGVAAPVVANGSLWRVNAYGTNLGTIWRGTSYNDSQWPRLRAPFGFGYADVTLLPSNHNNVPIPTFYFRQWFTNDFSGMNLASITLRRDDGAVIYLNGAELARLNLPLPPANILFTNMALTNVPNSFTRTNPAIDSIMVPLSLLTNSANLLAVEVHQGPLFRDRFDLYFGLELAAMPYTANVSLQIQALGPDAIVKWPDWLTGWQLEQSPDLNTWKAAPGTATNSGGYSTLEFPMTPQMFFRLHQVAPP